MFEVRTKFEDENSRGSLGGVLGCFVGFLDALERPLLLLEAGPCLGLLGRRLGPGGPFQRRPKAIQEADKEAQEPF